MKKLIAALLLFIAFLQVSAQTGNPDYDRTLAESLGADDYGMKPYVLAILKTGSARVKEKSVTDSLFRGHMENISRLAAAGKLVVAGPLGKNDRSYRGIFIFNVKTIGEARQLLITDPAVEGKLLDAELYEWYGSAALPEYLKSHARIEKKKP